MKIQEKIRRESATIRVFFATILIVPFQTWLFMSGITEAAIADLPNDIQYFFPDLLTTIIALFLLPIIYCTIVSSLFYPKRLVSPLFVQTGTAFTFLSILIYRTMDVSNFTSPNSYSNLVASFVMITTIMVGVGFIQEIIVKMIIGLNYYGVDRKSFIIDLAPVDFLKAVEPILHDVWKFNRRKDNPKAKKNIIWVLKSRDSEGNITILTVGKSRESDKTTVATVAFHVGAYGVSISDVATKKRESLIRDVNGILSDKFEQKLKPTESVDDTISLKAYTHALSITRSKTKIAAEFFKNIHWYYRLALVLTTIAFAIITACWVFEIINFDAYITTIIVIVLALIFEFGISLRQEWLSREIEELE
jgi:hypothetical protein